MPRKNPEKIKSFLQFKQNPTLGMFKTAQQMEEFAKKAAQEAVAKEIEGLKSNLEKDVSELKKQIPKIQQEISSELKKAIQEHIGKDGVARLKGEKGDPGRDGVSPDIEEIARLAAERARPVKGVDFDDGKDADPEEVARIILQNPEFRKQARGKDGKNPDPNVIARMLSMDENFMKLIRPKDGRDADENVSAEKAFKKLTKKKLPMNFIDGLTEELNAIRQAITMSARGGGGGMPDPQHQSISVGSGTSSFTADDPVAASGNAIWAYYQGQLIVLGTHYTNSGDNQTYNLTFTPSDNTTIDLVYMRGS